MRPVMASAQFPLLLSSLELRGRRLRNRIVATAHTTSLGEGGLPGRRARDYYLERARGGVGLIVTEPTPVHETARLTVANFLTDDDRLTPALARLAADVHAEGAALVAQLYHVGPHSDPLASMRERWGPSAEQPFGAHERAHAMTRSEIREVVGSFARAARRAARADVDGVEVLMAHDGLIDSFLSPLHNRRGDEYGGSFENRLRLAREVLWAVREAIGDGRILGITLSGDHFTPGGRGAEDCAEIAAALVAACDIDYVAVGNAGYLIFHLLIPTMDVEPGFGTRFARVVKAALPDTVVIAQGRINTPALAEEALASGACDLVGMTRALIADPEFPEKVRTGRAREIRACIACNQGCWGRRSRQFFISCLQNPAAGLEGRYGAGRLRRARTAKRLVVVGGGPAGLEAARVAAGRGHEVVLLEREPELGGQALLAARLPHHREFMGVVEYRVYELERLGVDVRAGRAATVEEIVRLGPEVVLVATGSVPDRSGYQPALGAAVEVAPAARGRVLAAAEVVQGTAVPAGDIVVLDGEGHRKSLGTAELLAARGHAVTIVSADAFVGSELAPIAALPGYLERLARLGVRLVPSSVAVNYDGEAVLVRSLYDRREERVAAAALVLSTPHVADDSLLEPLRAAGIEALAIGDARAPRLMDSAIRDGFRVAFEL